MALPAEQHPQIVKYDLHDELGHGGMATVYRATDRRLGREVAIKLLHRHLRDSAEVARRFVAEARAVARLKHPNIVEIYDVSDDDAPERYLVAELVRGPSLRKLLTERPVLPAEIAACIGSELAAALAHAHERGVIHRDVKPENVLFSVPWAEPVSVGPRRESGEPYRDSAQPEREGADPDLVMVKLTDFGIAKLLDQQGVTATGQVLGSPAYMAPEQIDGDEVDARADIFSLGVLLYESMVGHLPFDGKTPGQVLKAIISRQFAPADRERPQIGARWARIVHRALAPEIEKRYPTMLALRADLDAELARLGISEPRRELGRFFRDPDGYDAAISSRLVSLLVEQGSRALRQRDRMAAADAINRAGAIDPASPQVASLVKKLISADSFDRWKGRIALGAGCTAVAILLGAGAWKLTRPPPLIRARELPVSPRSLPPIASSSSALAGSAPPGASSVPAGSTAPAASSVGSHRLANPTVAPKGSAEHEEFREVILERSPISTIWFLDGNPLRDLEPQLTMTLRVGGTHTLVVKLAVGNDCCEEERSESFTVTPPTEDNRPLLKRVVLRSKPAILDSKGPAGFLIRCAGLGLQGGDLKQARGTYKIDMGTDTTRRAKCLLLDNATTVKEQSVTVYAGRTTELTW